MDIFDEHIKHFSELEFVQAVDIKTLVTNWLLSHRSQQDAADMRYPEWSENDMVFDIMPKCDSELLPSSLNMGMSS